ncbi:MAG: STAS domain-containing protein [Planctomycetes bacterium]|nr:STAS domain-containing protein [Planctomycetota bacterium]
MSDIKSRIREERGVTVVQMPEQMTAAAAYDLEEPLMQVLLKDGPLMLLDMSEVSQITSASISLLIKLTKAAERKEGMVAIASPTAVVQDVFAITKMNEMLHVFDTDGEARKALGEVRTPVAGPKAEAALAAGQKPKAAAAPGPRPAGDMSIETVLFDKAGPAHTDRTLDIASQRAAELGIDALVVATTTGQTALKAAKLFEDTHVKIIGVTLMAGVWDKYAQPDPDVVREAEEAGVTFLTATHTLMGNVGSAIREKFGGVSEVELIAHTYYTFSQGMKVAVEVAVMAADAGLVSTDADVIAIAGTGSGADTAIVIRPAYSNKFFSTKIREVLAMPR